jgi:hypothetical protein
MLPTSESFKILKLPKVVYYDPICEKSPNLVTQVLIKNAVQILTFSL